MDPQERILDAVMAVVARRGLPAVSVRSVAAEAGVSPAQVQYYFSTKERLLMATYQYIHRRMRRRAARVEARGPIDEVLRRYLLIWFPIDASQRTDVTVWLAFSAAAVTTEQFLPIVRQADAEIVEALAGLVAHGQATGALHDLLRPSTVASLLLAVMDGLSMRALTHPDPNHLLTELDELLNALSTGTDEP